MSDQIKDAIEQRRAVIRWTHGNWENTGKLLIFDTPEEAEIEAERDTRGKCWSMADEVWSELCTDENRAIRASKGLLIQR